MGRPRKVHNSDLSGDVIDELDTPNKRIVDKVTARLSPMVTIIVGEPAGETATDQFFSIQGKGYLIKFGEPVTVPRHFVKALDNMVQTRMVALPDGGYTERDFKRFPYQVVNQ